MKVVAEKVGLYGGVVREIGEEFEIADKAELGEWMVPAGDKDAVAGIARRRAPLATPARAETGPNPAIASAYAEAGMQTTAVLLELQEARVALGEARTRQAELEAEVARLRASIDEDADVSDVSRDAAKAIKAEAEQRDKAVKAAEEAWKKAKAAKN